MEERAVSTDQMLNVGTELVGQFKGVLGCMRDGREYSTLPPRGPPEIYPSLTEQELKTLENTLSGKALHDTMGINQYAYETIDLNIETDMNPRDVPYPDEKILEHINICGIDGSNQRVERGSFYFLVARSAFVNFKYSKLGIKPFFYTKRRDLGGVEVVDGNMFNNNLKFNGQYDTVRSDGEVPLLPIINKNTPKPLLFSYNPTRSNKSPKAQALGLAVKMQQSLELFSLGYIEKREEDTVCIRDGPLFSTSVSIDDSLDGLKKTLSWTNQTLISSSKRVSESTLLVQILLQSPTIRNHWFPEQNLTDSTLQSVATDMLLLPKILKPGQRTPLVAAVPRARKVIVDSEKRLTPLVCYYYSRLKPHTFIRWEVPKFMWDKNKEQVEKAFRVAAWQHELGHKAPLVQLFADQQAQLSDERFILEKQTDAFLSKCGIKLPEVYE